MYTEVLNRWDIILLDRKTQSCRIDFVFFYDQRYHFEDVHLLEHLMLHQTWKVRDWIKKDLIWLTDLGAQVNWITSGIFLSINLHSIPEDMVFLSKIIVDFFDKKLNVNENILLQEKKLIDLEELYNNRDYLHRTYYPKVLDYSYMDKLYSPHEFLQYRMPSNEYNVNQIHKDIIIDNRVSIIVRWDLDNKNNIEAISFLKWWLESKKISAKKYINNGVTYKSTIDKFDSTGELRMVGVFLSLAKLWIEQFAKYIFLYHIILSNLNELVRDVDVSDYWVQTTYRMVPYAWQEFFKFNTRLSSEQLYGLFASFFHKNKEDYEQLKRSFLRDIKIWSDDINEYYYVAQSYLFLNWNGYEPLYWIDKYIVNMTFADFKDFYLSEWLQSVSILDLSDYVD